MKIGLHMKKFLALTLALLLAAFFVIPLPAVANEGLSFSTDVSYPLAKDFDQAPKTFEALVRFPQKAMNLAPGTRRGIILSNYQNTREGKVTAITLQFNNKGDNQLALYIGTGSGSLTYLFDKVTISSFPVNEWVHIAVVKDDAKREARAYINGKLKQTVTTKAEPYGYMGIHDPAPICIGGDARMVSSGGVANAYRFKGEIAEIAIYDDVRTAAEIKADAAEIKKDSAMLVWYQLSEGVTGAADLSGNNNHLGDYAEPEITASDSTTDGPAIVTDGTANYRIVRGENASEGVMAQVKRVREAIHDATGVELHLATDWVKKGTPTDHETLEILIGPTDYSESAEALEGLSYGDYIIAQVGNKIVINAWGDDTLKAACDTFYNLVYKSLRDGDLILPADLRIIGTGNRIVAQLPLCENATLGTVCDGGNNCPLLVLADTTPEAFGAYMEKIAAQGYTLYAENEINDNRFATYVNDTYVINLGYYAYEKSIRATVELRDALPPREGDCSYESKVQPSVVQFGMFPDADGKMPNNGQGHLFQMSDGSYLIVDGGLLGEVYAKQLYDYMYANAPDPNEITIAAWIFTHGHADHTGAYESFTKTYASKVKLELLIGNFPSGKTKVDNGMGIGEGPSGDRIPNSVSSYPGSKFIRAHAGQEFFLRDAKIEILYTLESLIPRKISQYNTTSLIFTVQLAGQTALMLGDVTADGGNIVYKMYGEYLKADFLQAAHHGFNDGLDSVYTAVAAPVILWPCAEQIYPLIKARSAHNLRDYDSTQEIFVAGDRTIRLSLPYTAGTSGFESILG